jgi:hypothetical protein
MIHKEGKRRCGLEKKSIGLRVSGKTRSQTSVKAQLGVDLSFNLLSSLLSVAQRLGALSGEKSLIFYLISDFFSY